jgi:uncharacterized protein (DUF58 family)
MKSVAAAEAAALAAWRGAAAGDRVGAIVFADADLAELRPQGRSRAVMRILHELVRFNGALEAAATSPGNPQAFNAALRRAARLATHDWLICLITDAAGADAETGELVTRMSAHNDVLTIFVYDPIEAELPDIGAAVVADGALQLEVDTAARSLRRRFADSFTQRRRRIGTFSRERMIPVLDIRTDHDVAEQLRDILGRRQERRNGGAAR